jgi:hypothetical protein
MKRLETPPIELSPSLIESLDAMIVMINAKEKGKSARRVKEIVEIQSIDTHTGIAHTKKIFTWIPSEDSFQDALQESVLLQKISFAEGVQLQKIISELKDRKAVLSWMHKNSITDYEHVCDVINLYYKDKPSVMAWLKKGSNPFSKEASALPTGPKPAKAKAPKAKPAKKPAKREDSGQKVSRTPSRSESELKEIKGILEKRSQK